MTRVTGVTDDSVVVTGPRPLRGRLRLPGEKGMSHRALLFAALADGTSSLRGLAPGDDVARTASALAGLGVTVRLEAGAATIDGAGIDALHGPDGPIDCGNSGTTMRMLAGLLAGRPFTTTLTGDESLRRRPMARVVEPLRALGAHIDGDDDGRRAPLTVVGGPLTGTRVALHQASGQVKTALVLAGLQADGTTEIVEPAPSRDHTERMLAALGAPVVKVDDRTVQVSRGAPAPFELELPADPSSAAFLLVAATITPGSELVLERVMLNPGRIGFITAMREMGAAIEIEPIGEQLGEPFGDVTVRSATLHGAVIEAQEAIIDEIPALAVAGAFADGTTEFRDAAELRVKESDRVRTVIDLLVALGIEASPRDDGLVVHGGRPRAATFRSHGDHRIALAAAAAANACEGASTIEGWSAVDVSYPGFLADLEGLTDVGRS